MNNPNEESLRKALHDFTHAGRERMRPLIPRSPMLHLTDLQVEAVRGVLEELLTSSPTGNPQKWAMHAIGEISRILDMTNELQVMAELHDQEERRGSRET